MENKKIIIPMVIAVVVLIVITISATYAFFGVGVENNTTNSSITGSVQKAGSVAIEGGVQLSLDVTSSEMREGNETVWYATEKGKSISPTSAVVATATVTGEGTFNCTVTINAKATGEMYSKFQTIPVGNRANDQVVLSITPATGSGVGTASTYDFNEAGLDGVNSLFGTNGATIEAQMNGLTSSTLEANRQVTAQFKFSNTDKDQKEMAGTSANININIAKFECELQ